MPRSPRVLAERLSPEDRVIWRELQIMPNVGPAIAYDLIRLGMRCPADLLDRDADVLYDSLCLMDGVRHDPCVRDVFAAIIDHARTGNTTPWWHFTPERKARQETGCSALLSPL